MKSFIRKAKLHKDQKLYLVILSLTLGLLCLTTAQAQEPTPSPLLTLPPTAQPTVQPILLDHPDLARQAIDYIASRYGIPEEHLQVTHTYETQYQLIDRRFRAFMLLDVSQAEIAEYFVMIDLTTGQAEEDWRGIEEAEAIAYQHKYRKLSPALHERLQSVTDDTPLPIAVWLTGGGESEHIITLRHQLKIASDIQARTAEIAAEYRQELAQTITVRQKPVLDWLHAQKVKADAIQTSAFMPSIVAELPKARILALSHLDEVSAVYLLEGEGQPALDVGAATGRVRSLWRSGLTGSGIKVAILEPGEIDPNLNCLTIADRRHVLGGTVKVHKTRVAAVVACNHAQYKGIAYGAELLDVDFLLSQEQSNAVNALEWSINEGANVVNMSYGWITDDNLWVDRAFDYWARHHNRTIVVAAGNRTADNPNGYTVSPGKAWNVITVGGLNDHNTAYWGDDDMYANSVYQNPAINATIQGDRQKPEVVAHGQNVTMIDVGGGIIPEDEARRGGTSFAAPQVAGLAALLMQRDSRLQVWPEAVKAILMASAVHNIEGSRRLSNQDGAGGINAALADQIAQFRQTSASTACDKPCWWGRTTTNSNPQVNRGFSRYFNAAQGERIRVAMSWFSNADTPANHYSFDRLDTNYDLYVHYQQSDGTWSLASLSVSRYNNYEIVDFVAPKTSRYRIRVYRSGIGDNREAGNSVGLAWVKQATYLPDVRANVDGWQSTLYIRNDGATPVTPIVTFYDSQGKAYGPHNPANPLAPNAVWEFPLNTGQFQGSAIVSGSEDLSVVVAHRHTGPDKVAAYTGVTQPTPNVHVSLLLRNVFGIDSDLAIQNMGHTATNVKVQFTPHTKKDGTVEGRACTQTYTVAANGVRNIDLSGLSCLGNLFVGSAHISNNQNHLLAMATTQEEDQLLTAASNLHPGSSTLYAPLIQYGQPGSWEIFSSGSVQDTSGSTSNITIDYYNVNGSQCRDKSWTYKDIRGHQMNNTIPMPPDGNGCTNPVVAAQIDGGGQNKVAWINQRRGKAVSTYEASGQGSQAFSIPYVHNTGHWDTGISLQNIANEATEVTIKYYNVDGSHHSTQPSRFGGKGEKNVWLGQTKALNFLGQRW